jgi:hypothetical protein
MKPRSALQERKNSEALSIAKVAAELTAKRAERILPSPARIEQEILASHGAHNGATFDTHSLPSMDTFNRSLKTKDEAKVRLAVANHMFGRFTTSKHLQEIWWKYNYRLSVDTPEHRWNRNVQPVIIADERIMRERWYICAARGGSLYKEYAKSFMTKKEVHAFLNCPLNVTFEEAILYALASSHTDDLGVKTRILKSKIVDKRIFLFHEDSDYDVTTELDTKSSLFWREIIRFFCVNPVPINELNDFVDYLTHMHTNQRRVVNGVTQPEWSIKGRTLHSIREAMKQWHRDQGRVNRMGNRKWDGVDLPDMRYDGEQYAGTRRDWFLSQIKTSKDLAAEGNKMHHCVYSYQGRCVSGHTSIWSLKFKKSGSFDDFERALTLEVTNSSGNIVQIRGYANRVARAEEMYIVRKWASENGMLVGR